MFRSKAKNRYRGKCPTCGTPIQSEASSFKCPNCHVELQLKGRQDTERRVALALWMIPITVVTLLVVAFAGLLLNPRFAARYLPGYASYLESMDVGFDADAKGSLTPSDAPLETQPEPAVQSESVESGVSEVREDMTPEEIFERSRESVVTVVRLDDSGNAIGAGSGFFVDGEGFSVDGASVSEFLDVRGVLLVTNQHVIEDVGSLVVKRRNREIGTVRRVLVEDEELDTALLEVVMKEGEAAPTLEIYNLGVRVGESVFVIGSPIGLEGTFSEGIVSAIRRVKSRPFYKLLQMTCKVYFGSSGGPVFNRSGQVVGVVHSMSHEYSFAASAQSLNELMRRSRTSLAAQD